jgi:hypothetical protein
MTTAVNGKIMTMIENASSLTELAHVIREACQAARQSGLTALDHIFRAGEALNKAQEQGTCNWKQWLRESCFLGVSTALLYQRIARHRAEIEIEAKANPNFSLRAARQLITREPKETTRKQKAPPRPKPTLQDAWNAAAPSERATVLARMPLNDLLNVLPPLMQRRFEATSGKPDMPRKAPEGAPDLRASETLRRAISLARSGTEFEIAEAMAALRALDRMFAGAGIDEFTLIRKGAKAKRRAA